MFYYAEYAEPPGGHPSVASTKFPQFLWQTKLYRPGSKESDGQGVRRVQAVMPRRDLPEAQDILSFLC
jgi:hypothetical protein